MKRIAVFASGGGSNAEKIARHFMDSDIGRVTLVCTNNKKAGVIDRMKKLGIPVLIFDQNDLENGTVLSRLRAAKVDFIALAGFLKKIPSDLLQSYEHRIVNIHPALLPDYGGEGMYGMHVHEAVVENEEEQTGITIHYLTEEYDEGEIIFQATVDIDPEDTPEEVAYKVQQLEHAHYPGVIESLLQGLDD